jgi:hypothetical protein
MNLGWGVWARALLFAAALGLAWSAVGLVAYGTYLLLIPSIGVIGAAFLAALICLALGALLATALVMRPSAPIVESRLPVAAPAVDGNTMVKALSELAQDHPLMAVACAAILGATSTNGAKRHH